MGKIPQPPHGSKPLKIGFILARDFTMSAFAMFVDTLRLASDVGDRSKGVYCDWEVVSATGHLVKSSASVEIAPTSGLGDPCRFSHLVTVGGLLRQAQPLDEAMIGYLRKASAAGVTLIGVCTGTFILARAGLMAGRRACVSWYHFEDFREQFPEITALADRLFFVDGNRITCSGGAGAADLAALLVERYLGLALKEKALQVLQIEKARAPSYPQPRSPLGFTVTDDRIRRCLLIMEQTIADPMRITALAARVGLSDRMLERLFLDHTGLSPNAAYVRVRLHVARWLVVTTRQSMTDVAASTGFTHSSNFSRRFKDAFGISPTKLRQSERRDPGESHRALELDIDVRHATIASPYPSADVSVTVPPHGVCEGADNAVLPQST